MTLMTKTLSFFAAAAGTFLLSTTAFATSTIECKSQALDVSGQVAFVRYNVGAGFPTSFMGGLTLSDEFISSGGPTELDPTTYLLSGFFSDETETNMSVVDDLGYRVLLLKTIKDADLETGFLNFGGRSFEVTCRQIG